MPGISLPALALVALACIGGAFGTTPATAATTSSRAMQVDLPSQVNLNTADAETLRKVLSGVGRTKATAIVEHRQTYGPFESVDELLEVTGIGKILLDRNRDKLTVE